MPKGKVSVGIEIDSTSMRAAKVLSGKGGVPLVAALAEVKGNFRKDEEIIGGLKSLRHKVGVFSADTVVTCVGGKQTYVAQLTFKKLPADELKTALKFEIRKNLSFDTAASLVEYQFLAEPAQKGEPAPVIVTAVANVLLQRYLRLFERAGVPPVIIDVFPLTVANTLWVGSRGKPVQGKAFVLLHIGPDFSTVVIEGNGVPFFSRAIYFSATELFDRNEDDPIAEHEVNRRIAALIEEITRSVTFYENNYRMVTTRTIAVLGSYMESGMLQKIGQNTGYTIERIDLVNEFDAKQTAEGGTFDVAVTLGMRGNCS